MRQFNKVQAIHAKLATQREKSPEDLLELNRELTVLMQMMNGTCSYPRLQEHMRILRDNESMLETLK